MKWVKKLENNLYGIRSKRDNNIQRVIYFRVVDNRYVITHSFTKKQQKISKKEICKGKRIRRNYLN
ncbi:type II toxin-antitoxin system RelE/ParE family toxin [Mammaliicoccus sciuri]|uniref:type II toxin-antitoxin system RelE/ParE family toxin n=1 Tax=Mammaliicoccus sciuri TaxID=1296 RepID=UPI0034DD3709